MVELKEDDVSLSAIHTRVLSEVLIHERRLFPVLSLALSLRPEDVVSSVLRVVLAARCRVAWPAETLPLASLLVAKGELV
jgi:hypothetical protein